MLLRAWLAWCCLIELNRPTAYMVPPHCTSCRTTSWLFLPDPTLFSCGVPTAAAGDAPDCAAPLPPAAEAAPAGAAELARPATRTAAAVTAPLVTLHRPT